MTVLARLVAKEADTLGYVTYVFECLDEEILKDTKYIMCTRYPNWNHRTIDIGEVGYLNFFEIRAGVDKWFDGEKMISYNYNGIQFDKFVSKPKEKDKNEYIMQIIIKLNQYEKQYWIMTVMREKLMEAIEAKNNDTKSFVWKLARKSDGTQEEVRLVDATPEQLNTFYRHCKSMLYSEDKLNPGRYVLLNIIEDQRRKCNVELFLRKLESGVLCADRKPYPRHLYIQDIRSCMNARKDEFPSNELDSISIATITGGLPREFERISIEEVLDGGLDRLGHFDNKHITFSFILNMGVYLTPAEMKEFDEKDANGNPRKKPEVIKERLGLKPSVELAIKPTGLNFSELRAMINLKPKKYSDLTTDQLTVLRNKVLFRLEDEVQFHIEQWKERMRQIELVAKERGITLDA